MTKLLWQQPLLLSPESQDLLFWDERRQGKAEMLLAQLSALPPR